MKSPKLYTVRKFKLKDIINSNYSLKLSKSEEKYFNINQSDNMLFRQIRLIANTNSNYNKYVVFVDCKGSRKKTNEISSILRNGFTINNQHFMMSEKSASMSRNAILGFVDETIAEDLNKSITMDLDMTKTVISKYTAYRGLMFSSCICIEDWFPKVIVVDDYETLIENQHVRYVQDKETEYLDSKTGDKKTWKEKDIVEGYHDIKINPFDGCGIHHPLISDELVDKLNVEYTPTSVMWRFPFIKGVTHSFDYTKYLLERDVSSIRDIWGEEHDVSTPMIILTKSMYKGFKYFQKHKDIRDWNFYWEKFHKYKHCIGVAKWNKRSQDEPFYTRANYQILQDLNMDFEDFLSLSDESIEWASNIINGDTIHTYAFLGLFADKIHPMNNYAKAILRNPEMLKEECVRSYFINLLKKHISEFKCGKLWLESTFRILTPDLIMLVEYIGGLEPKGILKNDEFYSKGKDGFCNGEYLIERNPHICASEHVVLRGVSNDILDKYCSHLEGIVMVNSKSITMQKLNGADVDGDLCLVLNHDRIRESIDRNRPTVIDMEDKIIVPEEDITVDTIIKSVLLSMDNRIGEYSNVATGYHNKNPQSKEQKNKYEKYIDLVSILNGKEIDAAKTGVRFNLPHHISRFSKPLPYFMKYAGDYYQKQGKLSKSRSLMNRLCWEIEKWEKGVRYKRKFKDFNYRIMIDNKIDWNEDKYNKVELLYLNYEKEMKELRKQNAMRKNHVDYENYFGNLNTEEILNTRINWGYYYDKYREDALNICSNINELANYAVILCYSKYKTKNKKFMWVVASEGILNNIKQQKIALPIRSDTGKYHYLGQRYDLQEVDMSAQ